MQEGQKRSPNSATEAGIEADRTFSRMVFRGWLIVCAIAALFTLYGFLAFFVIGDKGPPDWDYGALPDVPAQSAYSTYPYRGGVLQPEPQHINQKPPEAKTGIPAGQVPSAPEKGPG